MHESSAWVPPPPEQDGGNPGEGMPFEGFDLPESNFWRLPNNWFDLAARFTSWAEHKVVEYILRHTWGYHEYGVVKLITMDEFMHGRKRRDGSRLDAGCGMAENSIKKGINDAVLHGFLIVHTDDSDRGRIKKYYAPRMRRPLPDEGDQAQTLDQQTLTPQGQSLTPSPQRLTPQEAALPLTPQGVTPTGSAADPRTEQDPQERHTVQETQRNNIGVVAFRHTRQARTGPSAGHTPVPSHTTPRQAQPAGTPPHRAQSTDPASAHLAGTPQHPSPRRVAQRAQLRALPSPAGTASLPLPEQSGRARRAAEARPGRPPLPAQAVTSAGLVDRLIAEGVAPARAATLVQQVPAERIERQLAWIEGRNYRDRAATLVAAIEGDFSMPLPRQTTAAVPLSPDRDKFYRGQYALCPRCGSRPCASGCDAQG